MLTFTQLLPDVMGGRKLDPNNNGARCTSIWKCTMVVLDMGLRKVKSRVKLVMLK